MNPYITSLHALLQTALSHLKPCISKCVPAGLSRPKRAGEERKQMFSSHCLLLLVQVLHIDWIKIKLFWGGCHISNWINTCFVPQLSCQFLVFSFQSCNILFRQFKLKVASCGDRKHMSWPNLKSDDGLHRNSPKNIDKITCELPPVSLLDSTIARSSEFLVFYGEPFMCVMASLETDWTWSQATACTRLCWKLGQLVVQT